MKVNNEEARFYFFPKQSPRSDNVLEFLRRRGDKMLMGFWDSFLISFGDGQTTNEAYYASFLNSPNQAINE